VQLHRSVPFGDNVSAPGFAPSRQASLVLKGQCSFCIVLLLSALLLPAADTRAVSDYRNPLHGLASWYGGSFHGRRAASGENYDMMELTAAHRTLPFGALVRVHRLDNDESVVVRINDRGPYVGARIIDLSLAAARRIGMTDPGVVPVTLELVDSPSQDAPSSRLPVPLFPVIDVSGSYAVQVGSFRSPDNAERTRLAMQKQFGTARIAVHPGGADLHRVLVGAAHTRSEAEELASSIRSQYQGLGSAYVVHLDASTFAAAD
jgi:rare lipoprotein A